MRENCASCGRAKQRPSVADLQCMSEQRGDALGAYDDIFRSHRDREYRELMDRGIQLAHDRRAHARKVQVAQVRIGKPQDLDANRELSSLGITVQIALGLQIIEQRGKAALRNIESVSKLSMSTTVPLLGDVLHDLQDTKRRFRHSSQLPNSIEPQADVTVTKTREAFLRAYAQ